MSKTDLWQLLTSLCNLLPSLTIPKGHLVVLLSFCQEMHVSLRCPSSCLPHKIHRFSEYCSALQFAVAAVVFVVEGTNVAWIAGAMERLEVPIQLLNRQMLFEKEIPSTKMPHLPWRQWKEERQSSSWMAMQKVTQEWTGTVNLTIGESHGCCSGWGVQSGGPSRCYCERR